MAQAMPKDGSHGTGGAFESFRFAIYKIFFGAIAALFVVGLLFRIVNGPPLDNSSSRVAQPQPTPESPQIKLRKDLAMKYYLAASNEGLQIDNVSTDGSGSEILVFRSKEFKYGPTRRAFFQSFDRKARKLLCEAGFEAITVKEGIVFGNSDTFSLGCK